MDKARQAVQDAMNGDAATIDAGVSRALIALAKEVDEARAEAVESETRIMAEVSKLDGRFSSLTRGLYAVAGSIIATVLSAAILLALKQQ